MVPYDDSDENDEYIDDDEQENDDFEYVKIKKRKPNKSRNKKAKKGIMEYINTN